MKDNLNGLLEGGLTFLSGLVPGALGAAIAVALEKGITWTQRFLQFTVGITVSYFARALIAGVFHWSDYAVQAASFTAGMIAFQSVKKFIPAAAETFGSIPGDLWKAVKDKLGIGSAS